MFHRWINELSPFHIANCLKKRVISQSHPTLSEEPWFSSGTPELLIPCDSVLGTQKLVKFKTQEIFPIPKHARLPHFYHPFIDGIFRIFHEINHLAIGMFVSDFPMEKKKHPASQPQSVHHRPPAGARSGSRWRENCTPPKGIIGMAFQGNPIAFRHLLLEFRN
jgi:hypothetical protein